MAPGTDNLQQLAARKPSRARPTFEVGDDTLTKRLTMILKDGRIEKVFYPVFPPNKSADEVVEWLSARSTD